MEGILKFWAATDQRSKDSFPVSLLPLNLLDNNGLGDFIELSHHNKMLIDHYIIHNIYTQ